MKLFDWLPEIIKNKPLPSSFTKEDWKTFSPYMIHKLLSMNPQYLEITDYVAGLNLEDNEKIYKIYCNLIPKSNRTFFPYIKSKAQNLNKEALKYVSDYYLCSLKEANEYMDIMGKDGFKIFLEKHGLDKKEITKLLK